MNHGFMVENTLPVDEFLMGRPSVRRSPTCRRKFKLERIPDYLRETVDWIIGQHFFLFTGRLIYFLYKSSIWAIER
ncbi:hypothetical protein TELCIR_00319 [Teladorsagia circumcincta]|uniref:Uncharacterized protein n=1 Tax=Teladorsagia circumcincta TaxID=45464 RepID=A0A2G9V4Y3_TELCI|nr:hypothetical protein TELCIR_00319 [Teladorsagia circumcincta]